MKALLFADLHTSYKNLLNIKSLTQDGGVDLLVSAGDIVNLGEPVSFMEEFIRMVEEVDLPLMWVPGNNDFGRSYYKLTTKYPSLEGRVLEMSFRPIRDPKGTLCVPPLGGEGGEKSQSAQDESNEKPIQKRTMRFTGVGGSPASWAGQYAGEEMVDKKKIGGSIFVSHFPPPGIRSYQKYDDNPIIESSKLETRNSKQIQNSDDENSKPVSDLGFRISDLSAKRFSDAPLVHICGHLHHRWGISHLGATKVVQLAALYLGYYAIMDLETLKVEFKRFTDNSINIEE